MRASANGLHTPEPIGSTGFWLETNQAARSVQSICALILAAFGHEQAEMHIAIA